VISIPTDLQYKVEGAFYTYFYQGAATVSIDGTEYPIDRSLGKKQLAWERKMLLIAADAQNEEKWLQIVETVFTECDDNFMRKFILYRYGLRKSPEDTCFELCFERSAYYRYRRELIFAPAMQAVFLGLHTR